MKSKKAEAWIDSNTHTFTKNGIDAISAFHAKQAVMVAESDPEGVRKEEKERALKAAASMFAQIAFGITSGDEARAEGVALGFYKQFIQKLNEE